MKNRIFAMTWLLIISGGTISAQDQKTHITRSTHQLLLSKYGQKTLEKNCVKKQIAPSRRNTGITKPKRSKTFQKTRENASRKKRKNTTEPMEIVNNTPPVVNTPSAAQPIQPARPVSPVSLARPISLRNIASSSRAQSPSIERVASPNSASMEEIHVPAVIQQQNQEKDAEIKALKEQLKSEQYYSQKLEEQRDRILLSKRSIDIQNRNLKKSLRDTNNRTDLYRDERNEAQQRAQQALNDSNLAIQMAQKAVKYAQEAKEAEQIAQQALNDARTQTLIANRAAYNSPPQQQQQIIRKKWTSTRSYSNSYDSDSDSNNYQDSRKVVYKNSAIIPFFASSYSSSSGE